MVFAQMRLLAGLQAHLQETHACSNVSQWLPMRLPRLLLCQRSRQGRGRARASL